MVEHYFIPTKIVIRICLFISYSKCKIALYQYSFNNLSLKIVPMSIGTTRFDYIDSVYYNFLYRLNLLYFSMYYKPLAMIDIIIIEICKQYFMYIYICYLFI